MLKQLNNVYIRPLHTGEGQTKVPKKSQPPRRGEGAVKRKIEKIMQGSINVTEI